MSPQEHQPSEQCQSPSLRSVVSQRGSAEGTGVNEDDEVVSLRRRVEQLEAELEAAEERVAVMASGFRAVAAVIEPHVPERPTSER
jgi:hypothetical protein